MRRGTREVHCGDGSHIDEILSTCPRCGEVLNPPPAAPDPETSRHRGWVELLETELTRPAAHTPVGELMEREILCVRPELSVETLALLFVERGLSGAPVVDPDARLVGFVSFAEIVRDSVERGDTVEVERLRVSLRGGVNYDLGEGFHAEEIARKTVGAIMTPAVVTVFEQTPVARAAAIMAFEGIRRIPVIDDERRVIGMISALDVIGWLASRSGYLVPEHHASWHRPRVPSSSSH